MKKTQKLLCFLKGHLAIPQGNKLWACYLHTCIKYIQGKYLTNRSVRESFGLKDSFSGGALRLIKEAVAQKFIKPLDSTTSSRYMKYIPIWV